MSCQILNTMWCFVKSCPVTLCQVLSSSVTSCHILSHPVTSCHIRSHPVTSGQVLSHHVTPCHAKSRPVTSSCVFFQFLIFVRPITILSNFLWTALATCLRSKRMFRLNLKYYLVIYRVAKQNPHPLLFFS